MTDESRRQPLRPLLPATARRTAGIVLGCAVLVLAGGTLFVHDRYADPLDSHVSLWAGAHLARYGAELRLVADLGQKIQVVVIIAVMVLVCLAARRLNGAVLAAVGAPAAAVATEKVLKQLVGHLYPYASYPSGHTTATFALVATAAVLLAGPSASRAGRAVRIAIVSVAVVVGCAVGIAVIGLGDHYFIDTVGGAATGIAVVLTATFVLDLPVSRSLLGLTMRRGAGAPTAQSQPGTASAGHPAGLGQTPER